MNTLDEVIEKITEVTKLNWELVETWGKMKPEDQREYLPKVLQSLEESDRIIKSITSPELKTV